MQVFTWLALLVFLLVLEAATANLVSIWFALGALAALISAAVAPGLLWMQIAWFVVVSLVSLLATRPIAKRYFSVTEKHTNADRYVDMIGVVTEKIDNVAGTGTVKIGDKFWTARSEDGTAIEAETLVKSIRIEGVKLIVATTDNAEPAKKTEADVL